MATAQKKQISKVNVKVIKSAKKATQNTGADSQQIAKGAATLILKLATVAAQLSQVNRKLAHNLDKRAQKALTGATKFNEDIKARLAEAARARALKEQAEKRAAARRAKKEAELAAAKPAAPVKKNEKKAVTKKTKVTPKASVKAQESKITKKSTPKKAVTNKTAPKSTKNASKK